VPKFSLPVRRKYFPHLMFLALVVLCSGTLGLAYFESLSPTHALWHTVLTITTAGQGVITPVTPGGRLVGTVTMLASLGLLGAFTVSIVGLIVSVKSATTHVPQPKPYADHVVICGWNEQALQLLEALRADLRTASVPVVLMADLAEKPAQVPYLVRGQVTPSTMEQANLAQARAAIVLGEAHGEAFSSDARAILMTMTIKAAYPTLYTCVELRDPHNFAHAQLARADDIIVSSALIHTLLVRAILDPGVTRVITHLLHNQAGHALHAIPVPTALVGKLFLDVLTRLKQGHNALVVAVQSHDGTLHTNPPSTYTLRPDDCLYIIATDRPQFPPNPSPSRRGLG
jgi:voltage-gated potassium channel